SAGGRPPDGSVRRASGDPDAGVRVSQGLRTGDVGVLRTGDVGADEIVLDDDPGGPSVADPDATLAVGRDHVASVGCGPADGSVLRTIVDLDAVVRVSQALRAGDVGADEILLDDDPGGPSGDPDAVLPVARDHVASAGG